MLKKGNNIVESLFTCIGVFQAVVLPMTIEPHAEKKC